MTEPVGVMAMGAEVPTGRAGFVKPAEVVGFDKTVVRLGTVAGAVRNSS